MIICAGNEEANLRKNLPLWLSQNYHHHEKPLYEVLVVNDNSEDYSYYYLNEMEAQYPHLRVLHLTQKAKGIPGKKFPLSMGIKSARYEYLLLTDADCAPASNDWLRNMVQGFVHHEIILGYSPYIKENTFLNKKIRWETLHSAIQYLSYAMAHVPYMGVGRNLAYMKKLFLKNKGFSAHHHLPSGDDDLFINTVANSKNTTIEIAPEAFTFSQAKQSKEAWHFQKNRHLSTGKYYQWKHKILLGLYAISHFAFWVLFVALLFFPALLVYSLPLFLLRILIYFFIFRSCSKKLNEDDLIPYILLFDIQYLLYNIQYSKTIFYKNQTQWK